jgi:ATP-dependent RNA helicase DDX20
MSRTSVQRYRSNDVVSEMASFEDLLLPAQLVPCLAAAGFARPSPVQAAAIPVGRVGRDMIVQAKSGTGKTLVFSVLCLDKIQVDSGLPQVGAVAAAPAHVYTLT